MLYKRTYFCCLGQALLQTMLFSRSFPEESMLSAKVEYECKMRGAQRMA